MPIVPFPIVPEKIRETGYYRRHAERAMKIDFRYDVDKVFTDAKSQGKPVLLDFSAAPM
jgi:hypothetical protein